MSEVGGQQSYRVFSGKQETQQQVTGSNLNIHINFFFHNYDLQINDPNHQSSLLSLKIA